MWEVFIRERISGIMQGWSRGVVVIQERAVRGLFHKKTEYKGYLKNARNLTGHSINDLFEREYHHGDMVETRYRMRTFEHGPEKGEEYIEFEILQ